MSRDGGPPAPKEGSGRRPGRRRRRRGPPDRGEAAASPADLARRALDALSRAVHAVAQDLAGPEAEPSGPLVLPVEVRDGPITEEAVTELVDGIRKRLSASLDASRTVLQGRVYCLQCDASDCVHATPPRTDHVFAGYTPTGKPEWLGFADVCIARREERVDRLYASPPEIIAYAQGAIDLRHALLPGFADGRRVADVLGQVVVGLVPVSLRVGDRDGDRVALSIQVVATGATLPRHRLRLNLIGLSREAIAAAAADADARGPAESLRRTLVEARRRLESLASRTRWSERRGEAPDLAGEVEPLLASLKGDVERTFRAVQRRTRHAQERHLEGERPTGHAQTDAARAPDERLLQDVRRNTVIVIGGRGRAHVFTREGRLVTSLSLQPGELDRTGAVAAPGSRCGDGVPNRRGPHAARGLKRGRPAPRPGSERVSPGRAPSPAPGTPP